MSVVVKRGTKICGEPAPKVRDLLWGAVRYSSPESFDDWPYLTEGKVCEALSIEDEGAGEMLNAVESMGLVSKPIPRRVECKSDRVVPQGARLLTPAGIDFSRGRSGTRISRDKANEIVARAVAHAQGIEDTPQRKIWVSEMCVFGSYAGESQDLGDVDIAVKLAWSKDKEYLDASYRRLVEGKRGFESLLKAGIKKLHPAISIHDMGEMEQLNAPFLSVYTAPGVAKSVFDPTSKRRDLPLDPINYERFQRRSGLVFSCQPEPLAFDARHAQATRAAMNREMSSASMAVA